MENYKKVIGEKVLTSFERKVTDDMFGKRRYRERVEVAADIAEEMPFVTLPFREHGILKNGERNTKILHVFQPNLWAQDFAHTVDKLSKMTVHTAVERGEASAGYVLETSVSIRKILKDTGKSTYEFMDAYREAAMIESAYYTRLGGGEMSERARKKIDTALMRRVIRNDSIFNTVIKRAGIDERDGLALLQFSEEIDLTEVLQEFITLDPYYNRRAKHIEKFNEINSAESVKLAHTKTPLFAKAIMERLARKYPAMAKEVAKIVG